MSIKSIAYANEKYEATFCQKMTRSKMTNFLDFKMTRTRINFIEMGRGYKRKTLRGQFDEEDMRKAVLLVLDENYSYEAAAKMCPNITTKTLWKIIFFDIFMTINFIFQLFFLTHVILEPMFCHLIPPSH